MDHTVRSLSFLGFERVIMKRITAVFLSILCILMLICPAVSAEESDLPLPPEEQEDEIVAEIYICTKFVIVGHVWIYVENKRKPVIAEDGTVIDDGAITVGCYKCPVGQGVSVGTDLLTRANGAGIYYNVEAYKLQNKKNKSVIYTHIPLTSEELDILNKRILKSNQWTPFTNCGLFATQAWNSVSDRHIAYGVFPFVTALSIISKRTDDEKNTAIKFKPVSKENVFKQKGRKDKAVLKPCNDLSLVMWVG